MAQIFGEIEEVQEGQSFLNRRELADAGIHRILQAGIDGNPSEGSSSIVLSGGYVDDLDNGDEIIYTGEGGRDSATGRQVADQSWDSRGNKGLIVSELLNLPVRVTRGYTHKSSYSPDSGYQYGGVYWVVEHFEGTGEDGFKICRYRLVKDGEILSVEERNAVELPEGEENPRITKSSVLRTIRDTKVSKSIKNLYDHNCQVCGIRIELRGVGYSEGAHIRPLGKNHKGPDVPQNVLCLCPNHHIMLDKGIFTIADDLSLIGMDGELTVDENHQIDSAFLEYHREVIYSND